ncbi:GEVED domain-containing protein [Salipiger sp. 1_MG-2023]|uniref:GEVED domain-containing protein n=1 Tax=Salipiger sp. 1_MG-2023 TaxID=3062665 RepID=UPI0026E29BED|nr:GEVED domain-containing protein [Salipiger sp. 1_MG-2023]MDO6587795.1 GEVED domain-containing protein [Salipiger sp. 1_MG-2023]
MASVQTSDSELLSPILTGLLGTDVGLSVLDWNAMASAELDLLGLLGESGQDITVSDPGQIANVDLTLLDLIDASAAVAAADGDTALVNALGVLRLPVSELGGTINLADLITIGLPQGALLDLELNALDLIGGAIQLYNYENVVTTTQPVALNNAVLQSFGIGGAEILLQVVEPPHFECGGAGTQFHTSTIRAKLSVDLADLSLDTSALDGVLGGLLGGLVSTDLALADLDLYFEFGRVDGEILSADPETKTASVILAPSAIDVFLGGIDDAVFFNRSRPIQQSDVDFGTVADLEVSLLGGLVRESAGVRVRSFAQSAPGTSETLFFSPPYPQRQAIGDGASSFSDLIGTLADNLDIEVEDSLGNLVGPLIDTVVEPAVGDLVGGLLLDAISPILDATVDPLLGFFGVGIGEAEASISGVTSVCTEFSDCPVSGLAPDGVSTANYGSPYHFIYNSLFMGAAPPDTDAGPLANATATGDDDDGSDDEDAVTMPDLVPGTIRTIEIDVTQTGGDAGYLQGWIDWDGNGTFDDDEQVARDVTLAGGGVISLTVTVPPDALTGSSFARFRWSTRPGLDAVEPAPDGEVEDMQVTLSGPAAPRLSGQVIADTGAAGGTAHDALQNGGEAGLGGIALRIETETGALLAQTVTAPSGAWSAALPAGYEGRVVVRAIVPDGSLAVSETTAAAGIVPSVPSDGAIVLEVTAGTDLPDLVLGIAPAPRLSQDGVAYVQAGQVVTLQHDYVAGSAGEVRFAIEDLNEPVPGAAGVVPFLDTDCDGRGDSLLTEPVVVSAGQRICVVARVATSTALQTGASLQYLLVAQTELAGISQQIRLENTDRVVIGRDGGGLVIDKTVENLSRPSGEGRANSAGPGDVLLYRLAIRNVSSDAITNVTVYDTTPPYTRLDDVITQSVEMSDGTLCTLAMPESSDPGYVGGLRWECDGEVRPGATATIQFTVKISD